MSMMTEITETLFNDINCDEYPNKDLLKKAIESLPIQIACHRDIYLVKTVVNALINAYKEGQTNEYARVNNKDNWR